MQTLWQDVRYGARMLLKQRGFTLIALAALALSIGANTAIFSAVNTLLLSPLPVDNIDRLVFGIALREGFDPFGSSFLEYAAYRDRSHSFVNSGIAAQRSFNLIGRGEPERVRGATVMADYLATLGVKPVIGRAFSAGEDRPNGPPVALISYAFWQKHFAGSAGAIGQSLNLDGRSCSILGVMPPGFDLPGAAEIWTPFQVNIDSLPLAERTVRRGDIIARLKPGFDLKQADTELKAIARQLEQEYPEFQRGWAVRVVSLRQYLIGDLEGHVRKALLALMAGVGFLLLICCANVANLQLARGISRERELALRRALGAGHWRLVRQLLTESLLLAMLGGIAGLLLAKWLLPILATLNPIQGISFGSFFHSFEIDGRVLAFSFFVTLLTGVIFGLLPALKAAGAHELMPRLKLSDQRSAGTVSGRRWFNGLIVAEIAIALTLLVCGGLMVQSFQRLQHLDIGFRPDNLLTMKMVLPDPTLPVFGAETLTETVSASLSQRRFSLEMIALFALTALLLASIGVYGVISYLVSERTREIGIRLALGAQKSNIVRVILQQGLQLAVVGAGVGLLCAVIVSHLMASLLYDVKPTDPLSFAGVAALFIGVALLACYIPARRATLVDPIQALRSE
jgi:putative ABC transport system permease protein